jgi:MFS family permease
VGPLRYRRGGLGDCGVLHHCRRLYAKSTRSHDPAVCNLWGNHIQQPIMFAVCLDIGGAYAGAMVGAMNTASQIGSLISSVLFGYLVSRFGSYNVPFIPMAALLLIGAWLWIKVDPTQPLIPEAQTVSV